MQSDSKMCAFHTSFFFKATCKYLVPTVYSLKTFQIDGQNLNLIGTYNQLKVYDYVTTDRRADGSLNGKRLPPTIDIHVRSQLLKLPDLPIGTVVHSLICQNTEQAQLHVKFQITPVKPAHSCFMLKRSFSMAKV